jgi:hypothetical protein
MKCGVGRGDCGSEVRSAVTKGRHGIPGLNVPVVQALVYCAGDCRPRRADNKETTAMAETYKGDFYCVKCKAKREAEGDVVETNGRRMAKGKCPVCGTNLNRILGKA